ncbi:MAG: D-alanine--D-alanine ligase [Tenacibaculum sp.]
MKKNIAVVMGGYSSEANISLQSGEIVCKHLNREKYCVYKVHILPDKWFALVDNKEFKIDKNDFSFTKGNKKIIFDCVFNAIHGNPGENGKLLAYFDLLNLKHNSAPFYQMALTFNKRDTLSVLRQYGIATAKSVYLNKGDAFSTKAIIDKLGLPCFVKPNNSGSSFGITKVYKDKEFSIALDKAFNEDSEVLIESYLKGTEVSVGVIKYKGKTVVLPITEIVSNNDFFDYDAKYSGQSEEITPARLTESQRQNTYRVAKKVYEVLKLKGFSRSEYILVNDIPHLLEVNTVPGLAQASILPKQAKEFGISLGELLNNAVEQVLYA